MLELYTGMGRLACCWWVAAAEKQGGMSASGNASPRSRCLPFLAPAAGFLSSLSCCLLLSEAPLLSPHGLELEAGLKQQWGGVFDLAVS